MAEEIKYTYEQTFPNYNVNLAFDTLTNPNNFGEDKFQGRPRETKQAQSEIFQTLADLSNLKYGDLSGKDAAVKMIDDKYDPVDMINILTQTEERGFGESFLLGLGRGSITGGASATAFYAALKAPVPPQAKIFLAPAAAIGAYIPADALLGDTPKMSISDRAAYAAGETVGNIAAFTPIPRFFKPKSEKEVGGFFSKVINNIVKTANEKPKTYFGFEALGALGAAGGAYSAEEFYPGRTGPRVVSEIAGGAIATSILPRLTASLAEKGVNIVKDTLSGQKGQTGASRKLKAILDQAGTDYASLKKIVDEDPDFDLPEGFTFPEISVGARTGDETVIAIENSLDPKKKEKLKEMNTSGYETLFKIANYFAKQGGDAEDLKTAAVLRKAATEQLILDKIRNAKFKIDESYKKLYPKGESKPENVGKIIEDALDVAFKDIRALENNLWEKVPTIQLSRPEIENSQIVNKFMTQFEETIPGFGLPKNIRAFFGSLLKRDPDTGELVIKDDVSLDTDTLKKFRSKMLNEVRKSLSGENPDLDNARIYGQLAEAALEDMNNIQTGSQEYDIARQFSKNINDVFKRSFLGDLKKIKSTGADKIPPELVFKKIKTGGATDAALRLKEIENASNFIDNLFSGLSDEQKTLLSNEGLDLSEVPSSFRGATQNVLKLLFLNTKDSKGNFDRKKIGTFLSDYDEILQNFPSLKQDLEDVDKAQMLFNIAKKGKNYYKSQVKNTKIFSNLIDNENPDYEIYTRLLQSRSPIKEINLLISTAKKSANPEEALNGLRTSLFDFAFNTAGGTVDNFSFDRFGKILFSPLEKGRKDINLITLMRRRGILDSSDVKRLEKIIDAGVKVERSLNLGKQIDFSESAGLGEGIATLAQRTIGSNIGGEFSRAISGRTSLIAQSAGSQFIQNQLNKMPKLVALDIIFDAVQDPQLFNQLMTNVERSPDKLLDVASLLKSYRLATGIELGADITADKFLNLIQGQPVPVERKEPVVEETVRTETTTEPRVSMPTIEPSPFQNIDIFQPQGQPMGGMASQVLREEEMRKLI